MSDLSDLLCLYRAARGLIAERQGWCKGAFASRKPMGVNELDVVPCDIYSQNAVAFCARGALMRAAINCGIPVVEYSPEELILLEPLLNHLNLEPVAVRDPATERHTRVGRWNNRAEHGSVVAAFDAVILKLKNGATSGNS